MEEDGKKNYTQKWNGGGCTYSNSILFFFPFERFNGLG